MSRAVKGPGEENHRKDKIKKISKKEKERILFLLVMIILLNVVDIFTNLLFFVFTSI